MSGMKPITREEFYLNKLAGEDQTTPEPITATIDPTTISLNEGENYVWAEEGTTTLTYMAKAAQRVLAMNRTLQKNLNAIELKKGGDVK